MHRTVGGSANGAVNSTAPTRLVCRDPMILQFYDFTKFNLRTYKVYEKFWSSLVYVYTTNLGYVRSGFSDFSIVNASTLAARYFFCLECRFDRSIE